MFTLHRKVPFWLEFTFTIFFYCFELFLNLLYSDLRNFLHSIQISSNEAVSKYVQNVLAMASEVFCLVFLLVLLLQPSKVCFETKGNNVDLYLNSHACAISPVQTHRILRFKLKVWLKVWLHANKNSSIAAIHSFSEDTKL